MSALRKHLHAKEAVRFFRQRGRIFPLRKSIRELCPMKCFRGAAPILISCWTSNGVDENDHGPDIAE